MSSRIVSAQAGVKAPFSAMMPSPYRPPMIEATS
jgi:hypothetical protein